VLAQSTQTNQRAGCAVFGRSKGRRWIFPQATFSTYAIWSWLGMGRGYRGLKLLHACVSRSGRLRTFSFPYLQDGGGWIRQGCAKLTVLQGSCIP
jgi:hypothetical protein